MAKRKAYWLAWSVLSMAAALYLGAALLTPGAAAPAWLRPAKLFFVPGATSHGHYQIEMACESCHATPFAGRAALQEACVGCHGKELKEANDTHPLTKFTDPRNADRLEKLDATLLPGLIDLHTHLTDRYGVHWEEALVTTTPPEAALWGARNARVTLLAGFTTCREMGPTWPYVDVELKKAIEAGAVPGPRLLVSGNYVSSTGGAGDARQFSIYVDVPLVRNLADGAAEVARAASRMGKSRPGSSLSFIVFMPARSSVSRVSATGARM